MKEIYDILREFRKHRGEKFALATLVHAEGSSYRRPGARMLICEDGRTIGSLSGGCLEQEVALRAREVLQHGKPAMMTFDTRRRFGCAGKIDIFIERASEKFLVDLAARLEARRNCRIVTIFEGAELGSRVLPSSVGDDAVVPREADSFPYRNGALVQEIFPPIRLLIFGEGPDSAPLRNFGETLGWRVILATSASELAAPSAAPTAAATAIRDSRIAADELIEPFDEWTAAVVKSHNYGRDFAALEKLLPLNLRYVGLVGPRKRRDQLLNDLLDLGVTINAGFFSPAGLDIGAESPEEIALAIISEIQRVFAGGSGESLREKKVSIHRTKEAVQLF